MVCQPNSFLSITINYSRNVFISPIGLLEGRPETPFSSVVSTVACENYTNPVLESISLLPSPSLPPSPPLQGWNLGSLNRILRPFRDSENELDLRDIDDQFGQKGLIYQS